MKLQSTKDYLLLIDEDAEIKEGDLLYNEFFGIINSEASKMVESWYKIIGYYPLTKEAKELEGLPLLPNPFKDNFNVISWATEEHKCNHRSIHEISFTLGCKVGYEKATQSDKQFSLEDMEKCFEAGVNFGRDVFNNPSNSEYIQSLPTQQLPKEFIPKTQPIDGKEWILTVTENGVTTIEGEYKY